MSEIPKAAKGEPKDTSTINKIRTENRERKKRWREANEDRSKCVAKMPFPSSIVQGVCIVVSKKKKKGNEEDDEGGRIGLMVIN